MNIPLYTQDGARNGEVAVSEKIFGLKPNKALIHKALLRELSNRRHPIAHTLTKGEVRGGGKKPYRQKGTGWARQGSTRNPHFKGGGVAFGPRNTRNFTLRAPKKERRLALFGILSDKLKENHVSALSGFASEQKKTKDFAALLKKLPFAKKILFVLAGKDDVFARCSRNIPRVKSIAVNYLNPADLLSHQDIVFLTNSLPKLEELYIK